jgi:hypothetical protein
MSGCGHASTHEENVGTATMVVCDACELIVCGKAN